MSEKNTTENQMRITIIGRFVRLHDEEYIARSFEMLGHDVQRITDKTDKEIIIRLVQRYNPNFVLCTKLLVTDGFELLNRIKSMGILTVSWNFDLYWEYYREKMIKKVPGFAADLVFSTDGGHQKQWEEVGINHFCIRQGIYKPECYMEFQNPTGVVFVGTENVLNKDRQQILRQVQKNRLDFKWYGKNNPNDVRGKDLNTLYANTKVVIGDSFYSPYYWSNRIVETLGRGGFLIHRVVGGLKEEYPDLVTYEPNNIKDLLAKIEYFMSHEKERREIVKKNFEHVKNNYTMDKQCAILINKVNEVLSI